MKKPHQFSILLLTALFSLILTACGNSASAPSDSSAGQPVSNAAAQGETPGETAPLKDSDTAPEAAEPDNTVQEDLPTAKSNILVVYFSRVGITPFDDVDAVSCR